MVYSTIRRNGFTMKRRSFLKYTGLNAIGLTLHNYDKLTGTALAASVVKERNSKLKVAACRFETEVEVGAPTYGQTGSLVQNIAGPLKTTVLLIEDGSQRLCLVASDFSIDSQTTAPFLRKEAAKMLVLDDSRILMFSSHNHSVARFAEGELRSFQGYGKKNEETPKMELLPFGKRFVESLRQHLRKLPDALEPATILWAQGQEGRITYNRKGRRADGSTYFMREEDRKLVGEDFNGDIDREVPVVVFQGKNGKPIAALLQFTGHPVTSYRPEKLTIFGDYPSVAADILGQALGKGGQAIPVAFLQGCAGDVNSKEMFAGGVSRAQKFGEMLGQSAIDALANLKPSHLDSMDYTEQKVAIPLAPLPGRDLILAEINEMKDFIRRAQTGDEDTLSCVGLNFPRALSPKYRSALVNTPLGWNKWALDIYEQGRQDTIMRSLDVPVYVLRLGDVAVIGMPFEPFQGIGRQIRAQSPYPLTIPCGYVNGSHAYVTDSANTGDREYMSAFYRYTRFRPPFAKPAGDVVADRAIKILQGYMEKQSG
ncbi:MAG: hypothetical protein JXB29_12395 [Sedimentisphaerales bacterium]|nr:hypothetical protein [Sedimentisphaerales bacterium]